MQLLRPSDYRQMTWKNGLGVTTEIVRFPDDGAFDWRVSIAQVAEDGPFSRFPGYDRVILTLAGAGMTLSHREHPGSHALGALEPYAFSGDLETDCVLRDGPIRDFNVITRVGRFTSAVSIVTIRESVVIEGADVTLLYVVNGAIAIDGVTVGLDETAIVDGAVRCVSDGATVIRVNLMS
jgi:uncharacterized protein